MTAVAEAFATAANELELQLVKSGLDVSHVAVDQLEPIGRDLTSKYRDEIARLIVELSEATAALDIAANDQKRFAPTGGCFLGCTEGFLIKAYMAYGDNLSKVLKSIQGDLANVSTALSALPDQLQGMHDKLAEARKAADGMSRDVKDLLGLPSVLVSMGKSIKSDSDVFEVDERKFLRSVDGSSVDHGLESLEAFMDSLKSTTSELERCMQCLEVFVSTALAKVRQALGGPIGYLSGTPPATVRVLAKLTALSSFDFKEFADDLHNVAGQIDVPSLERMADSVHALSSSAKKEGDRLITVLKVARQVEGTVDMAPRLSRTMSQFSNSSFFSNYISLGKESRGARDDDRYKIGDIVRGIIYKKRTRTMSFSS